jgi:hypothetical protein
VLPTWLAARDDRGQEDARGQERRRDPEDGQLQVPYAGEVVRQPAGQIDAEEAGDVGAVVLARRTYQGLDEEEQAYHEEEPRGGALRRGQGYLPRTAEGDRVRLPALPAEPVTPPAEDREQRADPGEQRDQRQDAPD